MTIILYALMMYITWVFFTAIMRLREVRDAGKLAFWPHPVRFVFAYLTLSVGLMLDTAVNWIICTPLGLEFPGEFLTTARLNRWYSAPDDGKLITQWRRELAKWFGDELLNDIDPDGKHIKG
ncbi:MAG TPA: hypothetical protein VIY48_07830 [Candidatus Paceibacterota bacterium]